MAGAGRSVFRIALAFSLATFAAVAGAIAPAAPAHAANPTSGFKADEIISDANFYDGRALTQSEVQDFLNRQVPKPTSKSLRNYSHTTRSKPASAYCKAYAAQKNESAARIIAKVGQACGISQKALVVILQKEQGLVTLPSPDAQRYDRAMGFACPDSGPNNSANCDKSYYGFCNQVYNGARQLKRHGMDPSFSWFPVGRAVQVQYHPDKQRCGTKTLTMRNKATAALHYYTPYTPNTAALAAGWGEGDKCSSYGNRNFYSYYKSWFGSPLAPQKSYVGREL